MDSEPHKNLITLFKIFRNRPYHLAKYLSDNSAFNKEFLKKISQSKRLSDMTSEDDTNYYFSDITEMEEFYSSILEDVKKITLGKSKEELEDELNKKLNELILKERYEEAAQLRDYMIFHKINRKQF